MSSLTRRELWQRITTAAYKAAEYENGSEYALALDLARRIRKDAELLEESLRLRLAAIEGDQ